MNQTFSLRAVGNGEFRLQPVIAANVRGSPSLHLVVGSNNIKLCEILINYPMNFDVNYLARRRPDSLARSQGGAGEKYELVLGIPVRTPAERRGEVSRASSTDAPVQICGPQNLYFCINKPLSLPSSPVAPIRLRY